MRNYGVVILKLENEIKDIDLALAIQYDQTISQPHFFDKYQAKKNDLATLMEEWEELTLKLETLG